MVSHGWVQGRPESSRTEKGNGLKVAGLDFTVMVS